ncbi:MAG: glycosyltransferase family 4 protein [Cycloclasticus sp.]
MNANVSMIVWNEFRNDARVLKEAQTLQSAGYQVTVHALHTPGVTQERETLPCGVKVVRVARSPLWKWRKKHQVAASGQVQGNGNSVQVKKPSGPITKLSLKGQLLRIIARSWTHLGLLYQLVRSKPDVVHGHDVNTLPTAWLASVIARVPLVYDAHEISTDREGYASFRKIVGWVEKKLMPRAAGTITTTDIRAKFFALAYKVPRPLVLQNRPRLTQGPKSEKIRQQLGLKEDWPIVIYQGGLQQGRGLERIVDAAQQVEGAYFVFIGGGRLELPLKEQTARLGLEDKVHFIDTVSLDELPQYTASADIGVQAIENTCLNHYSTDSNKLFEYMMAGLPVIATSLPEIRKLVLEHDLGLLVASGETNELASAIRCLVGNSDMRQKLGKNSAIAAQQLNWEGQEGALLTLYKDVLAGKY